MSSACHLFIETERLRITNLRVSSLDDFHAYRSDAAVTQYQSFDVMSWEEAEAFIFDQKDQPFGIPGEWTQFGIELLDSGTLIGDCAVMVHADEPRIAEIGITLARNCQGKGYAKEALTGLIDWLFRATEVLRVVMITDTRNVSSIRLMERTGLRREGHFIDNLWFKGNWTSEYQYAILKREWRA